MRIGKARGAFERGYTLNWTIEVFIITDLLSYKKPIVYKVEELADERIEETFYEKELQKIKSRRFAESKRSWEEEREVARDRYWLSD